TEPTGVCGGGGGVVGWAACSSTRSSGRAMSDLLGGPHIPQWPPFAQGLRRGWLAAEANLDGLLRLDLLLPAVWIGGDGGQRVLQGYAARDVAKARAEVHRADADQGRLLG